MLRSNLELDDTFYSGLKRVDSSEPLPSSPITSEIIEQIIAEPTPKIGNLLQPTSEVYPSLPEKNSEKKTPPEPNSSARLIFYSLNAASSEASTVVSTARSTSKKILPRKKQKRKREDEELIPETKPGFSRLQKRKIQNRLAALTSRKKKAEQFQLLEAKVNSQKMELEQLHDIVAKKEEEIKLLKFQLSNSLFNQYTPGDLTSTDGIQSSTLTQLAVDDIKGKII